MSSTSSLTLILKIEKSITRLDQAILDMLRDTSSGLSRNQLKTLFEEKRVRLAGVSRPASWSLLPGSYEVELLGMSADSKSTQAQASPKGSFLPIAYEDDELLVLNKQSGVPSVPHSSQELDTAVGSALAHVPGLQGIGRGDLEPGLLHRLDTGTSGLLAFAKTQEAYDRIHEAWKSGKIKKIYRAWVEGDTRSIKFPTALELTLAHHPESQRRMIVLPEGVKRKHRGKPLSTSTTLLDCHRQTRDTHPTYSDLEIEIKTGVMHQIRCTLAHLELPILGDPIYNSNESAGDKTSKRLLLHAWKLIFPAGVLSSHQDKPLEIKAPLPDDFKPESD
jgi:23S rRNA pseudouridine1911/1915/1917 synthase